MTKYEYVTIPAPVSEYQLDAAGADGWRLDHFYPNGDALMEREVPTINEAFGKKLVKDCRDNSYWFGEIRSPNTYEEEGFGFDRTDIVSVGLGDFEVHIPVSAARIFGNIKTLEEATAAATVLSFQFCDCDHDYAAEPNYPYIFPAQ